MVNLVLMVVLLFFLLGIFAVTAIVYYASDEVEILHETNSIDSSIFRHNLFQFLTLFPTILIVLQILINLVIILQENLDEVYFYIQENGKGIWILKGVFGLSLLLLTGMLGYKLQQSDDPDQVNQDAI